MFKTHLLVLAAFGLCLIAHGCDSKDMLETTVYFLDAKETSLMPEKCLIELKYEISAEKQFVNNVEKGLNILIKGPGDSKLRRAIPKGTKLLSVSFKDHVVYADFSKEFKSGLPDDPRRQALMIDSIVLSLAKWPGTAAVKFLVEGESLHPFAGYEKIDEPISNPILPR
ncbi:MAG: GerMN domain-containing protein [Candidatus Poribacteria bacterium]|nr:GerMN domain-containing protein [Candidatus Poribacteria bacterium]